MSPVAWAWSKVVLSGLLLLCTGAAFAAPDEEALGKRDGYPYERLGDTFSLFTERYKVGNFTSMDKIFWAREVAAPASARPLRKSPSPFSVSYSYQGQTYSLEDFLARQRVTGLLILKGDTIVREEYQYDRRVEHAFTSMSMSKTVVALLAGIALHEGKIRSLDDPAQRYAPDLKGTLYGSISVRDLLRMSSGAKWSDHVVPGRITDPGQLSADTFFRRGWGGPGVLSRVRESAAPPGTRFNYSSADTQALAFVVRGAIGGDLTAYLSEKLWKPMGAESSATWLTDWSGAEAAFCCLNARLRDFGRLGILLASDGVVDGKEVVPRTFMREATDPSAQPEHLKPRRATPFFGYGYQTWLYPYRTRTFQARGLYGQEIIVQPSSGVVVVLTSVLQTPHVTREIFAERNYFVGAVLKALGGQADVHD